MAKIRTTVYLPEDLLWEMKRVAADRKVKSDTAAVEAAVRAWVGGESVVVEMPAQPAKRSSREDEDVARLVRVLRSGNPDAVKTVRSMLSTLESVTGASAEKLTEASSPTTRRASGKF